MSGFIIHTGSVIGEYLEARGINQRELAQRTGVSEKHISNLLNGKSRLTEEMALKLERVMPDVPASYWLNYEMRYREYLARNQEEESFNTIDLLQVAKQFHFKEVFKGVNLTISEQAIEMLKILGVSSFGQVDSTYKKLAADFMEDGGERAAMIVWLRLCENEIEIQNDWLGNIPFDKQGLLDAMPDLKEIALNTDINTSLCDCRMLLNELGVYLAEREAITNCKVRGALVSYFGNPAVLLSRRFKTHDHVWFALMHEIGHLILHFDGANAIVSPEDDNWTGKLPDKEIEANKFARNFFIDPAEYAKFIASSSFTSAEVRRASEEFDIDAGLLAGFLLHDGFGEYEKLECLRSR